MNAQSLHVLWFDDEWDTDRAAALAPWERALSRLQPRPTLTRCNNVRQFARLLEDDAPHGRYGLLILDVMLIEESERTYAALGFDDESVEPYDAGAQIAELIRSSRHAHMRKPWLQQHASTPLLVLSSSPRVMQLVRQKVGRSGMQKLSVVAKELRQLPGAGGIEAHDSFLQAVNLLLAP